MPGAASPFWPVAEGVRVAVQLQPAARRDSLGGPVTLADGALRIRAWVTAPPEGGKTNARLLAPLAALGLVAAACGDDDNGDSSDTTAAAADTTAAATDTTATETTAPSSDTTASPDTTGAPADGPTIQIRGQDFSESVTIAEVYGQFLEANGYDITSAYTAVRDEAEIKFVYRDALWSGSDMLALGVSSFGYMTAPEGADNPGGGMHYQNQHDIVPYMSAIAGGEQPMYRALPIDAEEAMIREWVLQLKIGRINRRPFIEKFGVDPFEKWADVLKDYVDQKLFVIEGDEIIIPLQTLLRIDTLLVAFFKHEHRGVRYA